MTTTDSTESIEQKETNRVGTINSFGTPDETWTAEYPWTRYRGPAVFPVPGDWVLSIVEGDGTSWYYMDEYGDGVGSEHAVYDALDEDPSIEDPFIACEDIRLASADLTRLPASVESDAGADNAADWEFTINSITIFRRTDPARDDLYAAVADALAQFDAGESPRNISVSFDTGTLPEDVQEQHEIEQRKQNNKSLTSFE